MKLQTEIRDNHTMSLENKPTTYSSMIYLRFMRIKISLFEVSQKISESSDFAKTSQADYDLRNSSREILALICPFE